MRKRLIHSSLVAWIVLEMTHYTGRSTWTWKESSDSLGTVGIKMK